MLGTCVIEKNKIYEIDELTTLLNGLVDADFNGDNGLACELDGSPYQSLLEAVIAKCLSNGLDNKTIIETVVDSWISDPYYSDHQLSILEKDDYLFAAVEAVH